jgi:ATP-dependent helicase/DNAse subunit B
MQGNLTMNRLEQDAADTLQAHEDHRAFRDAERARWARAQPPKIVRTWSPVMTEQQKQEHQQYIEQHRCPF